MADANTSLPIRTETNGDVAVFVSDGTTPSQLLKVNGDGSINVEQSTAANLNAQVRLQDGTGTGITSQANGSQRALDVGIDVAGVQIDPRQIRTLTSADVVTANQGAPNTNANGWFVKITDGTNNATVLATGEQKVAVTQLLTEDHNYGTVGANTLRSAAQVGNATGAADFNFGTVGAQTLRTAAEVGNATGAADFNNGATGAQTLRVAANLAVGGANVTTLNPVPVTIETAPGTHINDFKDASAIAAGSTDNHDYTVTAGKTLHLNQLESSASGKAKMVVQIETGVATGVFNTVFVQFNSTATTNMVVKLNNDISVAAGVRVRLAMSNLDKVAMDLYSTISGYEI